MKKFLIASTVLAGMSTAAMAEDIKIGILFGFTGPIETLTPPMAASVELAIKEVNDSGLLLDGQSKLVPLRADSTCIDSAAATAAAERLVTSENVAAIVGADCSGVTVAVVNGVSTPNGVPTISPSATSPALSSVEDRGYFFRTVPSDARQGEVLAEVVKERGLSNVAITYTNNDYGKGLADSFSGAFTALGGTVAITAAHEDGKADYSAEVGALSASGAEDLVVFGYVDQGGRGIVQTSLDTGAFSRFVFADGMIGQSLIDSVGEALEGSFGTAPGGEGEGLDKFHAMATEAGIQGGGTGPFDANSYDAAALIALAIQAAGSADRAAIQSKILEVANEPGEVILAGELAKGLQILKDGGQINYQGASGVEFNDAGEVFGQYRELEVKDGSFQTIAIR
jgi:branched-chain amino acid transport system substrate-binding protein